jgi:transposase-like protein
MHEHRLFSLNCVMDRAGDNHRSAPIRAGEGAVTNVKDTSVEARDKERAVAMVFELRAESGNPHGSIARVGERLGINPETLRNWVERAEIDGVTWERHSFWSSPSGRAG